MNIERGDTCINLRDPWKKIQDYRVLYIENDICHIEPSNSFFKESTSLKVAKCDLAIYPFSIFTREKHKKLAGYMNEVGDLIQAFLSSKRMTLEEVKLHLLKHEPTYHYSHDQLEWIIRCIVCVGAIVIKARNGSVAFEIHPEYKARQRQRSFSATIASELSSLSERVRLIIDHGPTVGTYRENLLQNVLKKHLPERYHVATGFIFGIPKQIDILIYDRIDYAPIFREGDLVVVPPESVRAVIEVKTKLNVKALDSALDFIHMASLLDDNTPPFFKGVFAFESDLSSSKIYKEIIDFYADADQQAQHDIGKMITQPFNHLTCLCVVAEAFAYTHYARNESDRLIPYLMEKQSSTNLESQVSFFMQSLLSHLKFGGVKRYKVDYFRRMLGADSFGTRLGSLMSTDSYGAYFEMEEMSGTEQQVKDMEEHILAIQNWLIGEDNYDE